MTLPAEITNIDVNQASLPASYENAKNALAECARIDECQSWASKAEALASYAKQADDDTLRKMADRIQARAVRRAGELLKQIEPDKGGRPAKTKDGADRSFTRKEAAAEAGMSERQQKTAIRTANVPEDQFEKAVESDNPPTVTQLSEQGKQTRKPKENVVDLQGRNPESFKVATRAQGMLRDAVEVAGKTDPATFVEGLLPHEQKQVREQIHQLDAWLDQVIVRLKDE